MEIEVWQLFTWAAGILITVLLAVGGMLVGTFRALSAKIDQLGKDQAQHTDTKADVLDTKIEKVESTLHDRVNRLRDDMNTSFVRRIDLDGHIGRWEGSIKEMRDEIRGGLNSQSARLDHMINVVTEIVSKYGTRKD